MIDQLEQEYATLLAELPKQLSDFSRRAQCAHASLTYINQIGETAGQELIYSEGNPDGGEIREMFIEKGFDRPIGRLTFHRTQNTSAPLEARTFCDYLSLRSYQLRNEICASKIANLVKTDLNENSISKSGYSELAHSFSRILGTSGFVLWHVCSKKQMPSGEYELQLLETDQQIDDTSVFLHVLGSFPSVAVDMPLSDGIASYVMRSGKALRIDDILDINELARKAPGAKVQHPEIVERNGWRSGVFLPLASQGRLAGVVGAYSRRVRGFNNLDELLVNRCADQIAAYFVVHRSRQRYSQLLSKVEQVGVEVAAAQYSVYGSVHDAINAAAGARNNVDFIVATRETDAYFTAAKDHIHRLSEVLGKLRTDIRNPKKIPLQRAKIDLKSFLNERLQALGIDAKKSGIELRIRVEKEFFVDGDRFRLSQSFFNIVSNSIRHFSFTTRFPKTITVDAFRIDMNTIRVVVTDNGPGIDPRLLPDRVFEPFVSTADGMGLGLTIVRTFVEDMGGQITITSRWGEGTTVTVLLPSRRTEV